MLRALLAAVVLGAEPAAADTVVADLRGQAVARTPDFAVGTSPYVLRGTYLWARSLSQHIHHQYTTSSDFRPRWQHNAPIHLVENYNCPRR